jgi:hypothetical protein
VKIYTVYVCVGAPYSRDPNWILCLDYGIVYWSNGYFPVLHMKTNKWQYTTTQSTTTQHYKQTDIFHRGANTNVDCIYFHMFITWRLTTELRATQSIKHIKACMHVWISTYEINSDISKWNICEKVVTSRHLTTFTELSKYLLITVLEPSTFSKRH